VALLRVGVVVSKVDVYQEVADAIDARLAAGVVPWRKPFPGYGRAGIQLPRNYNSNRPYRGINVFLLAFAGYESPYWLTFKGAQSAGGQVRKGERSTLIVFWKRLLVEDKEKPGEKKAIMFLRYYRVFNVEQCDGIDPTRGAGEQPEEDTFDHDSIEDAESITADYFGREGAPTLTHGGNVAYYAPGRDVVNVPDLERFEKTEEYYSATFHEMTHSTGHESRLARKGVAQVGGNHDYADEELVAEMGAAMLCGVAGIAPAVLDNAAAYIDHWRKKISDDPKLVVNAAARAQKAADFVLGTTFSDDTETNEQASAPRELALA
jgi:antirestriction protein ArdC